MNNHHSTTSVCLRLIELQLDLAEADLKQLRSSLQGSPLFVLPLLLAMSLLLAFPLSTAGNNRTVSNNFDLEYPTQSLGKNLSQLFLFTPD